MRKRRVAVVDDDPRIRESLDSLLSAAGYDVELYESGEQILNKKGLEQIACLVSDVRMPGMDGFELHRRALATRPGLSVILISAHHDVSVREQAVREHVFAYFYKPFDGVAFIAAVNAAVQEDVEHKAKNAAPFGERKEEG
jgi:FixJ family two-component response regulator